MNLLSFNPSEQISSESEGAVNDIDAFLAEFKSTKNNNQINIVKTTPEKKSATPVNLSKPIILPVQEKKDCITVNDCINKGSSIIHSQKSKCEFSDSDIEFDDFMFSDDEKENKKNSEKANNKNNISNVSNVPIKIQSSSSSVHDNYKKVEIPPKENNLDEFCIKDEDLNSGNGVFELSDISVSDKKEEINVQNSKKEIPKINDIPPNSVFNISSSSSNNSIKETNLKDPVSIQPKSSESIIKVINDQDVKKDEPIVKKKESNIDTNIKSENKSNDNSQKKIDDNNSHFDSNIEIPKIQPKKSVKKRKKPAHRNEVHSPLNILDGLSLSFEDVNQDTNSPTKPNEISPKSTPSQPKKYNNLDTIMKTEKINIERVDKEQTHHEQTNLPPLQPKKIKSQVRTSLDSFEYSFIENLSYYLSDLRSSFLIQFHNQVQKYFDYDSLVKKFLVNFTRELNEEINKNSYYQDYVPISFTDVENNLNSEFNQFSSSLSNSERNDKGQFFNDEQILPIEQVESLHSKFANDCQYLLSQISKESQLSINGYDNSTINSEVMNSRHIEVADLESKLIQIDAEKEFVNYKLNYFKGRNSEIQEKNEFLSKLNEFNSNRNDLEDFVSDLKKLKEKKVSIRYLNQNNYHSTLKEICGFCSQIFSQFKATPSISNNNSFLMNGSYANNNISMNMSSPSFQNYDNDNFSSFSQNGIIEDVRNRLFRARKMREEVIEDLRSFDPRCNFSISDY